MDPSQSNEIRRIQTKKYAHVTTLATPYLVLIILLHSRSKEGQ